MKTAAVDTIQRARKAAALARMDSVVSPQDGLVAVREILSQLLGCEQFALLAMDAARTRLSLVAAYGVEPASVKSRSISEGLIGRAARRGEPFIAGRSSRLGASADEDALSAAIPLREGGQVAGVLALFRLLPHKRGFVAGDSDLFDVLSERAAIALAGRSAPGSNGSQTPSSPPQPAAAGRIRAVYLYPGDVFVSDAPAELSAVVGSCVALCLWDERLRFGGMSHYLLPASPLGRAPSLRFGSTAIPALIGSLERLGSRREDLRAKLFGGAAVNAPSAAKVDPMLGQQNAELGRRLLAEAGISIVVEDVGGTAGRKLTFRTDDGSAQVRVIGAA